MKKIKHNHKLTDFIKVGIFAIFLLMPFLVFVPNAFYYGFNEHAEAQERTTYPTYYQTNEVSSLNDLILGKCYTYTDGITNYGGQNNINVYFRFIFLNSQYKGSTATFIVDRAGVPFANISENYINISNIRFDFVIDRYRDHYNDMPSNILDSFVKCETLYQINENEQIETYTMSITDSMSFAWQTTWNNTLFSWTNNSVLKTPIDNFVGVFGITEQACISQYLIYLFSLMAIYIVADIIIGVFTAITHIINREPK